MKYNMSQWMLELLHAPIKKALPILSFPSVQLLGINVCDLINDSTMQARGMKAVAERTPDAAASVSLMDLSVEAQCFGAAIHISDHEVPTVISPVLPIDASADERMAMALALEVPAIGSGRTHIYIDAVRQAANLITDRPVFAGVIGPFSLAGRLMDVSASMLYCYDEPDMVHQVLCKATDFIIQYAQAFKEAGANGVIIAEPLAGLLSPTLAQEFSGYYCRKIVTAVQDDYFAVIYHNCGNTTHTTLQSILSCGAAAYHFGNAVDMRSILESVPAGTICMGNIDPAREFRNGTPESIQATTMALMAECCPYPNFVISSGCDIPPLSDWQNIDAFFRAVRTFYISAQ